jgi:hypothetical protein
LSSVGKKETRRERQEAWKVILKILRRNKTKIEMFLSIIKEKETYEESDKKLGRSF